jgi:hypothetical protein
MLSTKWTGWAALNSKLISTTVILAVVRSSGSVKAHVSSIDRSITGIVGPPCVIIAHAALKVAPEAVVAV